MEIRYYPDPVTGEPMMKKNNNVPKEWSVRKAQRIRKHYERQTEEQAVVEDEAAYRNRKMAHIIVPIKLVPSVRRLITRRAS
ncbi:MAG TPA: hypothetical protein VKK61_06950 [Tepidisphaeraceae bacterium]|jgi:hypothetical protein|nr:hypothetical protein [Tepidisphaeraceae bacterium]